ncbi:ATP-binding protein [Nocardiopsis sp. FIRDI 009]|uniref:ATP-binding protein n=1 Tax=Nocardiopsis sp. FIRDI 009 TaxID=714197 RepID=UPI000E24F365|nr:ATP-binding protein [Nocardiopsis sp. FIRDI 009]
MTTPLTTTTVTPRRLSFADPNRCGIMLGPDLYHVRVARTWAHQVACTTPNAAFPLVTVVSELVSNALRHTCSGDPGGTTRVVIERRPFSYVLTVTDNGPRPGDTIPVPRIEGPDNPRPIGGYGLRIVDTLAAYWDWSGTAGGPLTVRALIEHAPRPIRKGRKKVGRP